MFRDLGPDRRSCGEVVGLCLLGRPSSEAKQDRDLSDRGRDFDLISPGLEDSR